MPGATKLSMAQESDGLRGKEVHYSMYMYMYDESRDDAEWDVDEDDDDDDDDY